ncbi:hypothetical protein MTO96_052264 [Rhipicephalus appendiculatus]
MPGVLPCLPVYPAEPAGPPAAPPSAWHGGGKAAAWNAGCTCTATTSMSDTSTSGSKSSKGILSESAWPTDREAITCLETCIAFAVLMWIGVLVLFIFFVSGAWPFHGRPNTESATTKGISARRLSEAPLPYSSHRASSGASTEDVYIQSSTSIPDVTKEGQNSTNTTAMMFGDAQPKILDAALLAQ